jgi:acetyl esterase/lipase
MRLALSSMLTIPATAIAGCKVEVTGSPISPRRTIIRADREQINVERGVVYGTIAGESLLLDVYRSLPYANRRPAVILIHGGGMWTGSRLHMEHTARQLAQAGYVAFSVDYRLVDAATGGHRWPAQLDDAQRAVRWVRAHAEDYGVDPERVGAYGWSAGGQLAALLGARDTRDATAPMASYSSRVTSVVDLAGDVDLAAYTQPPALHEVVSLLGGTVQEAPERYRDASPLTWIDRRTAPFLVIHGDRDDIVPIEQSLRLVASLQAAGVEVEYVELANAGHDDLTWDRVGPAVLGFLARHLRPRF